MNVCGVSMLTKWRATFNLTRRARLRRLLRALKRPAALSVKIGVQTARPLAIVAVGGMILTLLGDRHLMAVLYAFYGNRQPPAGATNLAH